MNIKIIGQVESKPRQPKPIQFLKRLNSEGNMEAADTIDMNRFTDIELISRNYTSNNLDLIFCYKDNRNDFACTEFFLGLWNDGVI